MRIKNAIERYGSLGAALRQFVPPEHQIEILGFNELPLKGSIFWASVRKGNRSSEPCCSENDTCLLSLIEGNLIHGTATLQTLEATAEVIILWFKKGETVFEINKSTHEIRIPKEIHLLGKGIDYYWREVWDTFETWFAKEYPRFSPLLKIAKASEISQKILPDASHDRLFFKTLPFGNQHRFSFIDFDPGKKVRIYLDPSQIHTFESCEEAWKHYLQEIISHLKPQIGADPKLP